LRVEVAGFLLTAHNEILPSSSSREGKKPKVHAREKKKRRRRKAAPANVGEEKRNMRRK